MNQKSLSKGQGSEAQSHARVEKRDEKSVATEHDYERGAPTDPKRLAVFKLAVELKGKHPDAKDLDLKPTVQRWHREPGCPVGDWPWIDVWVEFFNGWPKVVLPGGMAKLIEDCRDREPWSQLAEFDDARLHHLASICEALADLSVPDPFYLSYRTAGEAIGTTKDKAGEWLKLLVQHGIIAKVEGRKTAAGTFLYTLVQRRAEPSGRIRLGAGSAAAPHAPSKPS